MKLSDLDAVFVQAELNNCSRYVENLNEAQGILFRCPGCLRHSILIWFANRGVPDGRFPKPRWSVSGTGRNDLTVTPSIDLSVNAEGCGWHGHIRNGSAEPSLPVERRSDEDELPSHVRRR